MESNGVLNNNQISGKSGHFVDNTRKGWVDSDNPVIVKPKDPIRKMLSNDGAINAGQDSSANKTIYETDEKTGQKSSETKTGHGKGKYYGFLVVKVIALTVLLYLFICSLDLLSSAFRLLGGKTAGAVLQDSDLLKNPVAGLMIGVLATVLLQSSSTTTSIIVSMVGADVLTVRLAIPLIMGANIGTSVTNTIVSIGHVGNVEEFKQAFAGATVHDMFNWLTVIILLPLEVASGMLYRLTSHMIQDIKATGRKKPPKLLKALTGPFTALIIMLDKGVIKKIALNKVKEGETVDLIKRFCDKANNVTCKHLFAETSLSNPVVGGILLVVALLVLIICLMLIVKILHSILSGRLAEAARKVVNQDFPKPFGWLTGYFAILMGALMTMLVQSSSVFTSALTPLVGIGVLQLERMYPLTLGSNIGTTITSILAALAADPDHLAQTLQIALCHLFFNIIGIMMFYPIPFMRKLPIGAARKLGRITGEFRWFVIVYLSCMFLILPGFVFGLSYAGLPVLLGVGIPILVFALIIVVMNVIQSKRPNWLPKKLRNWDFLPDPIHRLSWWDKIFVKCGSIIMTKLCCCCKKRQRQVGDAEMAATIKF